MRNMFLESGQVSVNKEGEDLCGDCLTTIADESMITTVLSDGLGSGVKANILATLTSKMLATMLANRLSIEDSVTTVAQTLPVCSVRKLAYSTFTVFPANYVGEAYLAQYDNPPAILLRGGKHVDYPYTRKIVEEKEIWESRLQLQTGDMLILLTDGVTHAGLGKLMPNGWKREEVITHLERIYKPHLSAKNMAAMLVDACRDLYMGHMDDDTTAVVFKITERQAVNLIIGPPQDRSDDEKMLRLFFAKAGKHVVCGGSTAHMVSRYLNEPLKTELDYVDPDIPPIAHIRGVDLVTEGVITINRVLEIAKSYCSAEALSPQWNERKDGATRIARMLLEEATDINFFVGRAINLSHQDPKMNIDFNLKMGLINELKRCLESMGKKVKISYC